jgi:hypothetical protein
MSLIIVPLTPRFCNSVPGNLSALIDLNRLEEVKTSRIERHESVEVKHGSMLPQEGMAMRTVPYLVGEAYDLCVGVDNERLVTLVTRQFDL